MKKIIILLGVIGFYGFQVFSETTEIKNNNSFEEVKNDVPVNWTPNQYFKDKNQLGTLQILSTSAQDGENCLMIKNDAQHFFHLYGVPVAAVPGDVIRLSAYVKGSGSFKLGVYMYDSNHKWLDGLYPITIKVECKDWEKKDFEMMLPDKEFGDKGKVAEIRPVIIIDADSEICLDNFSGRSDKAATPVKAGESTK